MHYYDQKSCLNDLDLICGLHMVIYYRAGRNFIGCYLDVIQLMTPELYYTICCQTQMPMAYTHAQQCTICHRLRLVQTAMEH